TISSPGGQHGGERLVPHLAFSEGFADWFGCAATGVEVYRDTTGRGDWGYVMVELHCESVKWQFPLVKGIGSESTVLEMIWDLYDGVPLVPDGDSDAIALGFDPILRAISAFDPTQDYPSLYRLLDELVAVGDVTPAQIDGLSKTPEEQDVDYPVPPGEEFPTPLAPGETVQGFVDARNPYHPQDPSWKFWLLTSRGNPYNSLNGYNSRRYFRITTASLQTVTLTLMIGGSGEAPGNLDLFLLDLQNGVIASSKSKGSIESIQAGLPAGTYVVEVRGWQDLGQGYFRTNEANFSLTRE
ncbi:MAG: hypothetical protein ACYTFG_03850, partial [Planctomycetota bacterium]